MKAISLTQPWATLVAISAKRYETRSWQTKYRGEIAIHASAGFPIDARRLCIPPLGMGYVGPFSAALATAGLKGPVADGNRISTGQLPLGAIIAVLTLVDITPTGTLFSPHSLPDSGVNEEEFGDYSPGRFAWGLTNVRALKEPVPCKGSLSLWLVPPHVEAKVRAQL
jgi:hypothetical protein